MFVSLIVDVLVVTLCISRCSGSHHKLELNSFYAQTNLAKKADSDFLILM